MWMERQHDEQAEVILQDPRAGHGSKYYIEIKGQLLQKNPKMIFST